MLDGMDGVKTFERVKPKAWRDEKWEWWQPKLDGWRLTSFAQGSWFALFGREISAHRELSHLLDHLPWYHKLPTHVTLDGELWVPGKPASEVPRALANRGDLQFTVFGGGRDLEDSMCAIDAAHAHGLDVLKFRRGPYVIPPDAEGVVLDGRWKIKKEETVDLVVIGIKPGQEAFEGMCGSLICSDGTREVACVSGMDLETRRAITQADVGRIVEVRYQYVGSGGRLRHPRFVRWRDDLQSV